MLGLSEDCVVSVASEGLNEPLGKAVGDPDGSTLSITNDGHSDIEGDREFVGSKSVGEVGLAEGLKVCKRYGGKPQAIGTIAFIFQKMKSLIVATPMPMLHFSIVSISIQEMITSKL